MQLDNHTITPIDATGKKVGIVVSRFNKTITQALVERAYQTLADCNITKDNITLIEVPGAIETPFALAQLARSGNYDALVVLGSVIKGETPHFDYVCAHAQQGALRVSLDYNVPIGFGIQTVLTMEQAQARIHIAGEAVIAALELALKKYE